LLKINKASKNVTGNFHAYVTSCKNYSPNKHLKEEPGKPTDSLYARPYMGEYMAEKFHGIMQIPYAPNLYKKTSSKSKAQLLMDSIREPHGPATAQEGDPEEIGGLELDEDGK